MQTAPQSIKYVKQCCCEVVLGRIQNEFVLFSAAKTAGFFQQSVKVAAVWRLASLSSSKTCRVGLSFKRIRGPRSTWAHTGQGVILAPHRWSGLRQIVVDEERWLRLGSWHLHMRKHSLIERNKNGHVVQRQINCDTRLIDTCLHCVECAACFQV